MNINNNPDISNWLKASDFNFLGALSANKISIDGEGNEKRVSPIRYIGEIFWRFIERLRQGISVFNPDKEGLFTLSEKVAKFVEFSLYLREGAAKPGENIKDIEKLTKKSLKELKLRLSQPEDTKQLETLQECFNEALGLIKKVSERPEPAEFSSPPLAPSAPVAPAFVASPPAPPPVEVEPAAELQVAALQLSPLMPPPPPSSPATPTKPASPEIKTHAAPVSPIKDNPPQEKIKRPKKLKAARDDFPQSMRPGAKSDLRPEVKVADASLGPAIQAPPPKQRAITKIEKPVNPLSQRISEVPSHIIKVPILSPWKPKLTSISEKEEEEHSSEDLIHSGHFNIREDPFQNWEMIDLPHQLQKERQIILEKFQEITAKKVKTDKEVAFLKEVSDLARDEFSVWLKTAGDKDSPLGRARTSFMQYQAKKSEDVLIPYLQKLPLIPNRWALRIQENDFIYLQRTLLEKLQPDSGWFLSIANASGDRMMWTQMAAALTIPQEKLSFLLQEPIEGFVFESSSRKKYRVQELRQDIAQSKEGEKSFALHFIQHQKASGPLVKNAFNQFFRDAKSLSFEFAMGQDTFNITPEASKSWKTSALGIYRDAFIKAAGSFFSDVYKQAKESDLVKELAHIFPPKKPGEWFSYDDFDKEIFAAADAQLSQHALKNGLEEGLKLPGISQDQEKSAGGLYRLQLLKLAAVCNQTSHTLWLENVGAPAMRPKAVTNTSVKEMQWVFSDVLLDSCTVKGVYPIISNFADENRAYLGDVRIESSLPLSKKTAYIETGRSISEYIKPDADMGRWPLGFPGNLGSEVEYIHKRIHRYLERGKIESKEAKLLLFQAMKAKRLLRSDEGRDAIGLGEFQGYIEQLQKHISKDDQLSWDTAQRLKFVPFVEEAYRHLSYLVDPQKNQKSPFLKPLIDLFPMPVYPEHADGLDDYFLQIEEKYQKLLQIMNSVYEDPRKVSRLEGTKEGLVYMELAFLFYEGTPLEEDAHFPIAMLGSPQKKRAESTVKHVQENRGKTQKNLNWSNWFYEKFKSLRAVAGVFDPYEEGNVPQFQNTIHVETLGKVREVRCLAFGTPTKQSSAKQVSIQGVFKGFLESLAQQNKFHLYISNQKMQKPTMTDPEDERPRNEAIGNLQKKHHNFYFMVFPKNSEFYAQKNTKGQETDRFLKEFDNEIFKKPSVESGWVISDQVKKAYQRNTKRELSQDIQFLMKELATFFPKQKLTQDERILFIETFYTELTKMLIVGLQVDSYNISCKDAIDRGAASNVMLDQLLALQGGVQNNTRIQQVISSKAMRALSVRQREMNEERFHRLSKTLEFFEKNADNLKVLDVKIKERIGAHELRLDWKSPPAV